MDSSSWPLSAVYRSPDVSGHASARAVSLVGVGSLHTSRMRLGLWAAMSVHKPFPAG
jgi:hypothetical protein